MLCFVLDSCKILVDKAYTMTAEATVHVNMSTFRGLMNVWSIPKINMKLTAGGPL